MIGLERGKVRLCDRETEWETEAKNTIARLKEILGDAAKDIQHVGSTSIRGIKAKPIIDIALAADNFGDILAHEARLKDAGFFYRPNSFVSDEDQILFSCGNYYDGMGSLQTHFIHVVRANSREWINYINFRDYMNSVPSAAKAYENLKLSLLERAEGEFPREKYTSGKSEFIREMLRKAFAWSYLGKTVKIKIDRPLGSVHPAHENIVYPVNYGYIPGVSGGDGEELDVYLLGVDVPVDEYTARVIGFVHRRNDVEDKLIAAPEGVNFTAEEIAKAVNFQEQYFDSEIVTY